jgi:hypothetical protein
MTHLLLLNLVFFIPATAGASAFAFIVYRLLKSASPPRRRCAGPDDLARSA